MAASVHATTPEVLLLDAPPDYMCPISKQLMVQPVLLVETGHTYEAAAIHKWLASSELCPVSGRKLSSKQTAPNYALKGVIADWAAAHGVTMQPAPVYDTVSADLSRLGGLAAAAAMPPAETVVSLHGDNYSSRQPAAEATNGIDFNDPPQPKGRIASAGRPCRCTRTRWAVAAIALLLSVAAAIGLGVGLPMVMRSSKGKHPASQERAQHYLTCDTKSITGYVAVLV